MKIRLIFATIAVAMLAGMVLGQGHGVTHLNTMISLMQEGKPVFGLYMPRDRSEAASPMDLAKQAMGNSKIDFLFNGNMPNGFPEFLTGLTGAGILKDDKLIHPIMLKIHKISENPPGAVHDISEQLNLGVSGQMFVEAETAGGYIRFRITTDDGRTGKALFTRDNAEEYLRSNGYTRTN